MNYVYHGSKTPNLKELIPHKSTHGNYVYATPSREIAIIMSKQCGDDATYSLTTNEEGKLELIERIPFAFSKMFANSFSLYTLDAEDFEDINTGFNEVVSNKQVPVIKEEKYNSLMDAIESLVNENLINIYYYPNRPSYIPLDDSDIINKLKNVYIKKLNYKFSIRELSRWIFLHPNLEEELRNIGKYQNIEVPSLEEIQNNFIIEQEKDKNHELYIDSALEMARIFKGKINGNNK